MAHYELRTRDAKFKPTDEVIVAGTFEECEAQWVAMKTVICWIGDETPIRKLSTEALASRRKKRLWSRLQKKHPLFAAELYEQELAARPDHYAGARIDPVETQKEKDQ